MISAAHGLGTHGGLTTHWLAQIWITVIVTPGFAEALIIISFYPQLDPRNLGSVR